MNVTLSPELHALLEQMSRDMAVPVEGLVNQAIFNWARLHGVLEASTPAASVEPPPRIAPVARGASVRAPEPEPETTRVPVIDEPATGWSVRPAGASLLQKPGLGIGDLTDPSVRVVPQVVLVLPDGEIEVTGERFVIGRDVSCDLTLDSPRLSRQHAEIVVSPAGVVEVRDLGSSNGTWYQGERITSRQVLSGDEFHFGDVPGRIELR
ncbi:MAG: FHA domain-containing protein [Myxococcota bacterium]